MKIFPLLLSWVGLFLLAAGSRAEDLKPMEPTPEELTAAKAAFAKLGGYYFCDADSAQRPRHRFELGSRTTDADLKTLHQPPFPFALSLNGTQVTDKGLKYLREIKNLHAIDLSGVGITDLGLKELAQCKNLRSLRLSRTQVTDAGLKYLKGLDQLIVLDLSVTKVTNAGVKELKQCKGLQTPGRAHYLSVESVCKTCRR